MILIAEQTERLDRFLARMLPDHSRTKLSLLIGNGEVRVNGKSAKPSLSLEAGMEVELVLPEAAAPHDLAPASIPLEIVFEDASFLVVNKPRGLASHPAQSLKEPSLVNALLAKNIELSQAGGAFRPGIVHRLDKETTGLMVVAKTDAAHVNLAKQIERKTAERRYFAIVAGHVERPRFTIDAPIDRNKSNRLLMSVDQRGRPAVTHLKVLHPFELGTVLACRLETGRTHQIRVHLSAVGHPVLGDGLYAPLNLRKWPLQLHAAYLSFDHPETGERVEFYAGPDESFLGSPFVNAAQLEQF